MNTKLSMRDKKLLLIFLGIAVFALGYFLVFRPQMAKAEALRAENVPLREKLNELKEIEENKDFYVSETAKYNDQVNAYLAMFPVDVKEEDAILLGKRMEDKLGISAAGMDFSDMQLVASLDGSASYSSSGEQQTLSEQANEPTQDQINQIEGTTDQSESGRTDIDISSEDVSLYRMQNTITFNCTYDELKNIVDFLASEKTRMTIDSVNVTFSSSTGELGGTIVVDMYAMTGTGQEYTEPNTSPVKSGNKNLFGTVSSNKKTSSDAEDDYGVEGKQRAPLSVFSGITYISGKQAKL